MVGSKTDTHLLIWLDRAGQAMILQAFTVKFGMFLSASNH